VNAGGATWTVLGAGSILPRAGFGSSGHALRTAPRSKVTLFDCGPGTIRSLPAAGIALEEVERVVISHFHLDHCLDLFALAFARNNPSLQPLWDLEIVGPVGTAALLARGEGTLGKWAKDPQADVIEVELDERGGAALARDGLALRCVRTGHTPEALAWRAEGAWGSVAYTGDSGEVNAVAHLARGADLFVIECSFPDSNAVPGHLTPSASGRMAKRAGCAKAVLTHFYPDVDPEEARLLALREFGGEVQTSRDGSVHPLA